MVEIVFQGENARSLAKDDGRVIGECTFSSSGGVWTVDHTRVDREYGGQGIARRLVDSVAEEARRSGVKLGATCSYAVKVFSEPEYGDISV